MPHRTLRQFHADRHERREAVGHAIEEFFENLILLFTYPGAGAAAPATVPVAPKAGEHPQR